MSKLHGDKHYGPSKGHLWAWQLRAVGSVRGTGCANRSETMAVQDLWEDNIDAAKPGASTPTLCADDD